jgi:hypothetical protein
MKRSHGELSSSVEAEMPQRMLASALAYYRAGYRCSKEPDLGSPGIVNYAFSIEVYMKLLILITQDKKLRGHNLLRLYDELAEDLKNSIFQNWNSVNWPSFETEESLRWKFYDAARVFEKWRYTFEHDFLYVFPDDLQKLAKALHVTVREFAHALAAPDLPDEPSFTQSD